jgi:hypothetical protein
MPARNLPLGQVAGRTAPVKSITLRSDWGRNIGGEGRPLNLALFTFNKNAWRFEEWGSREEGYYQNFTLGSQPGDPDFIGPLPAVGEDDQPHVGSNLDDDGNAIPLPDDNPWWFPKRFWILDSGFKGDDLLVGENPEGGHLGLRAKPKFIGVGWEPKNDMEVYIGVQCDLPAGGSPYDVGVMLGFRHFWNVGQRLRAGVGAGYFLQATSDEDAGGQEGNWTGDHHPYPFVEIKLEYDVSDLEEHGGLYFDVGVGLDIERGDPFLSAGLGFGF